MLTINKSRNFKVRANTNATCLDNDALGCEVIIDITLERTGLVKFCCIVVVTVNCESCYLTGAGIS
jgi:hypothetical protein